MGTSKRIFMLATTDLHTFDDVIKEGLLIRLSGFSPDLLESSYMYNSHYAQYYAKMIRDNKPETEPKGKNICTKYTAELLNIWHRACNTIHKTHKTYLADDLFTSKRIELKSYFYNFNTSNIISDAMIENVRENHKTLSRLATSDDIFLIRYEMEQWGDLYYHVLHRLGGGFQYDYLVKALAGALSVTVM